MTDAEISARFELAAGIAREAGSLALSYFRDRERLVVETKANPQDVVSIADQEIERLIRARVAACHSSDGFLGEEDGLVLGESGFTWVVDPIDGTSPFLNGMPNWCVSIAVLHGGRPVIGLIDAPLLEEHYAGAAGCGAFLNDVRLAIDPARTLRDMPIGFGANHHAPPEVVGAFIASLHAEGGMFLRLGSGALMIAYVAAGRLAGYFEPYMHAWDCLAGYCLVSESGGWYLPFPDGSGLTRGSQVLAGAPGAREDLLRLSRLAMAVRG
jgi:myo-inositol-1(or 4)-monophosphatase